MLNHPTIDQLRAMKLDGMADAFIELSGQEAADDTAHTMPIDRGITDADDGPGSELENEIELGRRRRPRGNER